MKTTVAAILLALSFGASANCVGSGSFQTCYDSSGNNYNVQRYGNTTILNGQAANGNTWNQTSQTMGNTTFHNGTAANGNSWSGSTMNLGNMQIHQGTNSQGQSYNRTCIAGICN